MDFNIAKLQNSSGTGQTAKTDSRSAKKTYTPARSCEEKLLTSSLDGLSAMGSSMVKKPSSVYHFLKKDLYSTVQLREFVSQLSEDEKYIGYLPDNWRAKFSKEDIPEKTKTIQKIFSCFATESYSVKDYGTRELRVKMAILSDKLSEILKETPKISFVGSGEYGKVFRIQCAGEDLALKIFHNDVDSYKFHHGNLKEINNAVVLNDTLKPNQCSKFYCGKLSEESEQGAFMLTDFVKEKETPPRSRPKLKRFILTDDRTKGNIIDNKIVDYGAIFRSQGG